MDKKALKVFFDEDVVRKYNLSSNEYLCFFWIRKNFEDVSIKELLEFTTPLFTEREMRGIFRNLTDKGLLESYPNNSFVRKAKELYVARHDIYLDAVYKPVVTKDVYDIVVNLVKRWAKIDKCVKHVVKPYDEKQTNTTEWILKYVGELLIGGKISFANDKDLKYKATSYKELLKVLDWYETQRTDQRYKPVVKTRLPKSLKDFFCNYVTGKSAYFDLVDAGGPELNETALEKLVEAGVGTALIKRAQEIASGGRGSRVLSSTKLDVNSILLQCVKDHKDIIRHIEGLYGFDKQFVELKNFNTFLKLYLDFIDGKVDPSRPNKAGCLSFSKEKNGYFRKFCTHIVDTKRVYLFVTNDKLREKIKKTLTARPKAKAFT